jgi:hypothetical protein
VTRSGAEKPNLSSPCSPGQKYSLPRERHDNRQSDSAPTSSVKIERTGPHEGDKLRPARSKVRGRFATAAGTPPAVWHGAIYRVSLNAARTKATGRSRTCDRPIRSRLLYPLSYGDNCRTVRASAG